MNHSGEGKNEGEGKLEAGGGGWRWKLVEKTNSRVGLKICWSPHYLPPLKAGRIQTTFQLYLMHIRG